MNVPKWIAPLFYLAALYDGVLGILFLFAWGAPFAWFDVTPLGKLGTPEDVAKAFLFLVRSILIFN